MSPRVTIVDYGMGNIRSLTRALERSGATVERSDDPNVVRHATRLAIPGQGAFGQAIERLRTTGLYEPLRAQIEADTPVLGICLGLQVLFKSSEEAPGVEGLTAIDAAVTLLPVGKGLKRPHMGWSPVAYDGPHPVMAANAPGEAFYFVHSYAARPDPSWCGDWSIATANQGEPFVAAVARGPIVGTQFHPEKSQEAGARLISAWLAHT